MPFATTNSKIISQQHQVHNHYNYNCVLFVFFYSPKKVSKNINCFPFAAFISVIVLCARKVSRRISSFSVIASSVSINESLTSYYLVQEYFVIRRDFSRKLITFSLINSNLCSPQTSIFITTTRPFQTRSIRFDNPLLTLPKECQLKYDSVHDEFMKLATKKLYQHQFNDVIFHLKSQKSSYVPNVKHNGCKESKRPCSSDSSNTKDSAERNGTAIENNCEINQHEKQFYNLPKGNIPNLHCNEICTNDMSKAYRHAFAFKKAIHTTLTALIFIAFLITSKKGYNLMNKWIGSPSTQAQCARHPRRQKEVRL